MQLLNTSSLKAYVYNQGESEAVGKSESMFLIVRGHEVYNIHLLYAVILGGGTMRAPLTMDSAGLHLAMAVQCWRRQPRGPRWRKTCCLMEHREQSRVALRLCSGSLGDGKANMREPGFGAKFRCERRWPHNKQFGTVNKQRTTNPAGAPVLCQPHPIHLGGLGEVPPAPAWDSVSLWVELVHL